MAYLPHTRIDRELAKITQVAVPYHTKEDFPYPELGNRRFELLLFALFRRGIEAGWFRDEFDAVQMISSPSGAGRILVLEYHKQIRGVVFARIRNGDLTAPMMSRDVIQFLLFSMAGQGLEFDSTSFKIFYAVAGGIKPGAVELTEDFNSRILVESRLSYWIQEVFETQPVLEDLDQDDLKKKLEESLGRIDLELILPEHLDASLGSSPDIQSHFFGVELVTTEQILKKILNEFQVKALTDEEADKLINRLDNIPDEDRMGVGLLNFFGYNRDFLKSISESDKLRQIIVKGAEFKAEIDYAVVDFLWEKSRLYSTVLLADGEPVGELAQMAVAPWIFSRFAIKYVKNVGSQVLEEVVRSGKEYAFYEEAHVQAIKADLLKEIAALDEDRAIDINLVDTEELRRRDRLKAARNRQPDLEQLSVEFDEDWERLKPVLTNIEKRMLSILPKNPLIVIEDMGVLDDDTRFGKLLARVRARFPQLGGADKKKGTI